MWIYHPFKPGAVPHRCLYNLGGVSCGRLEGHPTHQPPAETATPAEVCTGISDRAAAALAALAELRREHVGDYAAVDVLLDCIEEALRADGGA